jgi:cell division protein FtsI/penicillin-binding protein 2
MITAIAAAINGGNLMRPHVVKATIDADGTRNEVQPEIVDRAISEATSATMRQMMNAVVDPIGGFNPGKPRDYAAGGKSGTANVAIPNGYDDTQIASFVGFAPLDKPRILVLVKLDENQDFLTGTQAAGPIFSKLADDALHYLNVLPDAPKKVSR